MNTLKTERGHLQFYFLPLVFLATTGVSQEVAADIYSYVDKDGTRWLTNVAVKNKNAKLIARTPKTRRPQASRELDTALNARGIKLNSCMGLSQQKLEKRAAPHLASIKKYAKQYGVEENLVRAVIRQESCFNQQAQSPVGASGLMQLMPGTADMMGVEDIFDPQQNIRGGVKYLGQMLRKFDGDKQLALAAYNAGPGAVIKHGGIPPYRETQDYVVKVMAEYQRLSKVNQQSAQLQYVETSAQAVQPAKKISYARSSYQTISIKRHQGGFSATNVQQY